MGDAVRQGREVHAAVVDPIAAALLGNARAMIDVDYAGSPLIADYGSGAGIEGPHPGQRYPDWTQFGGTSHHVLVFGPVTDAASLARLGRRWSKLVQISHDPSVDPARAGVPAGGVIMIRPDGHIGFRFPSAQAGALTALDRHLSSYLIPDPAVGPVEEATAHQWMSASPVNSRRLQPMPDHASRFSLEGKRALVTGASRGIGAEIATVFADAGADVAIVGRDAEGLDATRQAIASKGRRCLVIQADLGTAEGPRAAGLRALEFFGTVDILVINAGVLHLQSLLETTIEQGEETLAVNLRAPFLLVQASRPE